MFQQLELDFANVLASAFDEPEQADIALMCASLDLYLEGRSHREQLRVAGIMLEDQFRGETTSFQTTLIAHDTVTQF
ncbi:hypothetical protein HRE53_31150 (plasmid) [Acaryochloris sp. 'Moss Beach']|uniref:hypothetical protein n=1 Tax=Acaryochloris sp. 'Moss Beach' TaxID=2740837 RepID=UPI001F408321|nr:hypothetical protein [Acaryochloris sp. 'Moss Beach']UJB73167.1 hypothetical protein HRE53_31150 [Acaryochloris sp. 'Moss Beach']